MGSHLLGLCPHEADSPQVAYSSRLMSAHSSSEETSNCSLSKTVPDCQTPKYRLSLLSFSHFLNEAPVLS